MFLGHVMVGLGYGNSTCRPVFVVVFVVVASSYWQILGIFGDQSEVWTRSTGFTLLAKRMNEFSSKIAVARPVPEGKLNWGLVIHHFGRGNLPLPSPSCVLEYMCRTIFTHALALHFLGLLLDWCVVSARASYKSPLQDAHYKNQEIFAVFSCSSAFLVGIPTTNKKSFGRGYKVQDTRKGHSPFFQHAFGVFCGF